MKIPLDNGGVVSSLSFLLLSFCPACLADTIEAIFRSILGEEQWMGKLRFAAPAALLPRAVFYIHIIPFDIFFHSLFSEHLGDSLPSQGRIILLVMVYIMLFFHDVLYLFVG